MQVLDYLLQGCDAAPQDFDSSELAEHYKGECLCMTINWRARTRAAHTPRMCMLRKVCSVCPRAAVAWVHRQSRQIPPPQQHLAATTCAGLVLQEGAQQRASS